MMIPHNRPTLGEQEIAAAQRVLMSGWVAQGSEVESFEDEMCALLGLPSGHAVAVSSGSAALYVALLALGGRRQQVALQAYSCRALWNAVDLAGGAVSWLDNAPNSVTPSADIIRDDIADFAIVAHMFGMPAPIEKDGRKIIIEDCAQALGTKRNGSYVGCAGAAGIFSFGATKPITSGGQGGMIVSRNPTVIESAKFIRDYDSTPDPIPRFNFQMTDLQAAIGRIQLARLPEFIARRASIYDYYKGVGLPLLGSNLTDVIRFRAVLETLHPSTVLKSMAEAGITAIIPITQSELLASVEEVPNAAQLCSNSISIPIYPSLTDSEVEYIADTCLRSLS